MNKEVTQSNELRNKKINGYSHAVYTRDDIVYIYQKKEKEDSSKKKRSLMQGREDYIKKEQRKTGRNDQKKNICEEKT